MSAKVYISRRVDDLERARKFWTALGFHLGSVPPEWRDKTMPLLLTESVTAALLTREAFTATGSEPLALPSPEREAESIVTVTLESRGEVDKMTEKAVASGGKEWGKPTDLGFLYSRIFADPDGHLWEFQWNQPPPK